MRSPLGPLLVLALFLLTAVLVYAGNGGPRIVTIDGIVHVQNPETPAEGEHVLEPERLWVIGGDSDADEEMFGAITKILVDDDGNTYLLDSQIMQVKVFSPEGKFLRSMGRSGQGPGEFQMPITMCFLPGNKQLGVVQIMPSRIVVFNLAGEPQPDFPTPGAEGFSAIQEIRSDGETVVVALQSTSFNKGKISIQSQLLRLDGGGNSMTTLWEQGREQNMGKMIIGKQSDEISPLWAIDKQGNVLISSSYNDYRIDVIGIDGRTVRVIERDYESRKRTEEEMARLRDQVERISASLPNFEMQFDRTDRDIEEFFVRDNGELWVISSQARHRQEDGKMGPFEVFDQEGRYIQDVWIDVAYDADKDARFILKNRLYVLKRGGNAMRSVIAGMTGFPIDDSVTEEENDDLEPLEVVCYKVGYATE